MRHLRRGFTMLELFVVIVILGLLTAIALPRVTDLQRDARISKLNAARDAVLSAIERTHRAAAAQQGQLQSPCDDSRLGDSLPLIDAAGSGSLCTDEGRVQMLFFYPTATVAGVVVAAGLAQPVAPSDTVSVVTDGYQAVNVVAGMALRVTGGLAAATCGFTYSAPVQVGRTPALDEMVTGGC